MKKTTIAHLILLTYIFLGCAKQDTIKTVETTNTVTEKNLDNEIVKESVTSTEYGQHTDEIQEILSATPLGSEIYLEQKESGEWYLKIEKTFTAKKNEEKTEIIEPIYGESILI